MLSTARRIPLFPAYAGVILPLYSVPGLYKPFPRTCGGDPGWNVGTIADYIFSPHMRG